MTHPLEGISRRYSRQPVAKNGYVLTGKQSYFDREAIEVHESMLICPAGPRNDTDMFRHINLYDCPSLLEDFLNVEIENQKTGQVNYQNIIDFTNKYGLINFNTLSAKEGLENLDESFLAGTAEEFFYAQFMIELFFEISNIIYSDSTDYETKIEMLEKFKLRRENGKVSCQPVAGLMGVGWKLDKDFASQRVDNWGEDDEIRMAQDLLLGVVNQEMGKNVVIRFAPDGFNKTGKPLITTVLEGRTLEGVLWHLVVSSLQENRPLRKCAARNCGKWFSSSQSKARTCSPTCRQRLRRDELKAEAAQRP